VQQVTADLYGIFLVTFSSSFGTEAIIDIHVRGSYNAPHRFLRFRDGTNYCPIVPDVDRPSEYRFPQITFANTQGELGVANNMRQEKNDGLFHPYRRPFPEIPVPEMLSPVPITVLGPPTNLTLQIILWINIQAGPGVRIPEGRIAANPSPRYGKASTATSGVSHGPLEPTSGTGPPNTTTTGIETQGLLGTRVDYF
jgi:hypothetical protein